MPPRRSADWIPRPGLTDLLNSPHAVVALVGPRGSGRSTLLAEWATDRDDVHWVEDGVVPEVTHGVLVVDDAEQAPAEVWAELDRRYTCHPELLFRIATTTPSVLPGNWAVEVADDLRLDRDAIGQYLTRTGSTVRPALVEFVSDGHADTVRVVARTASADTRLLRAAVARTGQPLPPDLAQLAVPDHLTTDLVAGLHGPDDFLEQAARSGTGWWHGPANARVFSLLPGTREATRARHPVDPARAKATHRLAADVLLRHGAAFASLREAAAAGDLAAVDTALKAGGMLLLAQHGFALMELLQPFPVSQLRRFPVTAMALALVHNAQATHRLRALELFGVVLVGARLGVVRPADRLLLRTLESAALRVVGAGDGGLKAARAAVTLMTSIESEEMASLRALTATLHLHLGISLLYGGAQEEAGEQFQLALSANPYPDAELMARGGIALIAALQGRISEARVMVSEALAQGWPTESLDEYAGSMLRMAQAQVALDDMDFEAADRALDTLWPIIDTIEHWPLLAQQRALAAVGSGRAGVGLETFRALRKARTGRFGTSTPVAAWLDRTEAVLLIACDRLVEARRVASGSKRPAHLALALVALCAAEDEAALEHLGQVTADSPRDRMTRAALQAVVLARLGHTEASARSAAEARALVETHGVRSTLVVLPADGHQLFGDLLPKVEQAPSVVVRDAPQLSPRELVVLRELVHTAQVAAIAENLQVSTNTVKTQRRSLYRKLGANSRVEALAAALDHGLLDD